MLGRPAVNERHGMASRRRKPKKHLAVFRDLDQQQAALNVLVPDNY